MPTQELGRLRDRARFHTFTERKNRPYPLICTKNRASHDRRVAQRRRDLDAVARL